MCRGKRSCNALGSHEGWSREAPLMPPDRMWSEVGAFSRAARMAADGNVAAARDGFRALRENEAREWFVEHAQVAGIHRARVLGLVRPVSSSNASRTQPRQRTPAAVRRRIWERDRYHCRYCALPTINEQVRAALQGIVGADVITWGGTNAVRHGIAFVARPEYDHVEPVSLGGANDETNLVTACPGCNYGKDRFTLQEIGLDDPRSRPPLSSDWDGLTSLLTALRSIATSVR